MSGLKTRIRHTNASLSTSSSESDDTSDPPLVGGLTPKANQISPKRIRLSTRLAKKRRRPKFSLPSRDSVWDEIEDLERPIEKLSSLTPRKSKNDFTKVYNTYNFDDYEDTGDESDVLGNSDSEEQEPKKKHRIRNHYSRISKLENTSSSENESEDGNVLKQRDKRTQENVLVKTTQSQSKSDDPPCNDLETDSDDDDDDADDDDDDDDDILRTPKQTQAILRRRSALESESDECDSVEQACTHEGESRVVSNYDQEKSAGTNEQKKDNENQSKKVLSSETEVSVGKESAVQNESESVEVADQQGVSISAIEDHSKDQFNRTMNEPYSCVTPSAHEQCSHEVDAAEEIGDFHQCSSFLYNNEESDSEERVITGSESDESIENESRSEKLLRKKVKERSSKFKELLTVRKRKVSKKV